jgi:predicted nucleic acid-binding protein
LSHLVDKSVLGHLRVAPVAARFRTHLDAGELAISTVTLLEQRVSDRSPEDSRRFDRLVLSKATLLPTDAADVERAREVQALLLAAGEHRGPSIADLLVAAVAERHGLTVLHLDRDFEIVARHTGQPVERAGRLSSSEQVQRPPRGTGIVQRQLVSPGGPEAIGPQVICSVCRKLVQEITDLDVHWHTDDKDVPLDGRVAFAHKGCSQKAPVSDYSSRDEGSRWLAQLCRSLAVPKNDQGFILDRS